MIKNLCILLLMLFCITNCYAETTKSCMLSLPTQTSSTFPDFVYKKTSFSDYEADGFKGGGYSYGYNNGMCQLTTYLYDRQLPQITDTDVSNEFIATIIQLASSHKDDKNFKFFTNNKLMTLEELIQSDGVIQSLKINNVEFLIQFAFSKNNLSNNVESFVIGKFNNHFLKGRITCFLSESKKELTYDELVKSAELTGLELKKVLEPTLAHLTQCFNL